MSKVTMNGIGRERLKPRPYDAKFPTKPQLLLFFTRGLLFSVKYDPYYTDESCIRNGNMFRGVQFSTNTQR